MSGAILGVGKGRRSGSSAAADITQEAMEAVIADRAESCRASRSRFARPDRQSAWRPALPPVEGRARRQDVQTASVRRVCAGASESGRLRGSSSPDLGCSKAVPRRHSQRDRRSASAADPARSCSTGMGPLAGIEHASPKASARLPPEQPPTRTPRRRLTARPTVVAPRRSVPTTGETRRNPVNSGARRIHRMVPCAGVCRRSFSK